MQTLAKEAVSLLNTAFRISAELERLGGLSDTTQQLNCTSISDGIHNLMGEESKGL